MKKLYEGKVTIIGHVKGTSIEIRPEKKTMTNVFLFIWLIGWGVGEAYAIEVLVNYFLATDNSTPDIFSLLWAVIWTYGGLSIIRLLIYQFFGTEVIYFDRNRLTLDKKMGMVLQQKHFDLAKITGMEVNSTMRPAPYTRPYSYRMGLGKEGKIRFWHEGKAYFMANGISEEEAQGLIGVFVKMKLVTPP